MFDPERTMDFEELISRLALAFGIGLLFGLERGWRAREERPGMRTAGIRTFAISGMLGGVLGATAQTLGGVGGGLLAGFVLAAYGAVMAKFCLEENRAGRTFSATTWVALVLATALGLYAALGDMRAAAALAVAATIILALRESIHGWVERITWPELRSGLVLLAMTFIALPIVPDDPVGPFGGVNPREVWIVAIVLAAVSFVGYAAVKYLGPTHGMLLAGVAGGLASSTAVTVTNARHAAAGEGAPRLLAAGVAMASAVMFVRVIAIIAVLKASLLGLVGPPLLVAAIVASGYALAATYARGADRTKMGEVKFANPFGFWSVVGFALFLGLVIVVSRAVGERFGAVGAIAGAAITGIADVDAITVAMARLVPQSLGAEHAAMAILSAVSTNTISKVAIGAVIGRGRFAVEIAAMASACVLAGGAALAAALSLLAT